MISNWAALISIGLTGFGGATLVAADKVELNVASGAKMSFVVERESESTRGDRSSTTTSRLEYGIEGAGKNDSGDQVFKVITTSARMKSESGDRSFEFDSTKEDSGGENGDRIRQSIGRVLTVTVSDGRVSDVKGYPEREQSERGRRRRGRGGFFGAYTVRRDLELIFASAVSGKELEAGKSYRVESRQGNDGQQRRRRIARSLTRYKFDGTKAGVATFALSLSDPEPSENFERKSQGKGIAKVSLSDGALISMKLSGTSTSKGSFNGRDFSSTSKSTTRVFRKEARAQKISLRMKEGSSLDFAVERQSESTWGDNTFGSSTQIQYKVSAKKIEGGKQKFSVAFAAVKVKRDGRNGEFVFDLKDTTSGGDSGDLMREAASKVLEATVENGRVTDIAGFLEYDRGNRRARFTLSYFGRRSVTHDLNLIFASAVQNQNLKDGASYELKPLDGDGQRSRGWWGRSPGVTFKYDGGKLEGSKGSRDGTARFSVSAKASEPSDRDRERNIRRKTSGEGKALVSTKDGALLRLKLVTESEVSGTGNNGQEFSSRSKRTTAITRGKIKENVDL